LNAWEPSQEFQEGFLACERLLSGDAPSEAWPGHHAAQATLSAMNRRERAAWLTKALGNIVVELNKHSLRATLGGVGRAPRA
jgi:hypothetical protein